MNTQLKNDNPFQVRKRTLRTEKIKEMKLDIVRLYRRKWTVLWVMTMMYVDPTSEI